MSISPRFFFGFLLLLVALLLPTQPAQARYLGGEPPRCPCQVCPQCNDSGACGCKASNTEGNLGHHHQGGMMAKSAFGATLDFRLVYNSKQADGSQSRTDTVMGYGWTHSFNILLFTQRGHMFRMDADGRITKYRLGGGRNVHRRHRLLRNAGEKSRRLLYLAAEGRHALPLCPGARHAVSHRRPGVAIAKDHRPQQQHNQPHLCGRNADRDYRHL